MRCNSPGSELRERAVVGIQTASQPTSISSSAVLAEHQSGALHAPYPLATRVRVGKSSYVRGAHKDE